ncbi:phosphotransferase enzyme family protein [Paenibacillus ginsengihumi]|uniref:phosphotransferase enzyme family protein n=1 Tax=Paenibacillus ginsengihumi TaxID=431596 RepID=UPI0003735E17|nr:phosphotransferase [Paenibacillus ginsengihumi]
MAQWQTALNEQHLAEAAKRYGVAEEDIVKVGGFENLVFRFGYAGIDAILRVSHTSHRSVRQIEAEIDWLLHLAQEGVGVSRPLASAGGNLMETIPHSEGQFILNAFEKAAGEQVHAEHPAWGPALFEEWGRTIGRMHACAKTYTLPKGMARRMREDMDLTLSEDKFASWQPEAIEVYRKYRELESLIRDLPQDEDGYGMCHRDLHHGNFFVSGGRICAFDFDDCGYDYFAHDIAMAVYYASMFPGGGMPESDREKASDSANRFFERFMRGYFLENRLDEAWLRHLPLFMNQRHCELSLILLELWGENGTVAERAWIKRNLTAMVSGQPCFELDV